MERLSLDARTSNQQIADSIEEAINGDIDRTFEAQSGGDETVTVTNQKPFTIEVTTTLGDVTITGVDPYSAVTYDFTTFVAAETIRVLLNGVPFDLSATTLADLVDGLATTIDAAPTWVATSNGVDRLTIERFADEANPVDPLPFNAQLIVLPEGNDPCDFLLSEGREAFERQLAQPVDWSLRFKPTSLLSMPCA